MRLSCAAPQCERTPKLICDSADALKSVLVNHDGGPDDRVVVVPNEPLARNHLGLSFSSSVWGNVGGDFGRESDFDPAL